MTIRINNKPEQLPGQPTITDALSIFNITSFNGVAVAVNNNIIPKSTWHHHPLKEDDNLTLIRASQGG